jgi:CheY-like chemotaxis protein
METEMGMAKASAPDRDNHHAAGDQERFSQQILPGESTKAGRILLAEDNEINQKVAVAMLSREGYRVDTVPDGAAAVQAVATQRYDAILMDCQLPGMSGYDATTAIRSQAGSARHTPIIAMTACARPEDREQCLAVGMDSYLSKPVRREALLDLVASSITSSQSSLSRGLRGGPDPSIDQITLDPDVFDNLRLLGRSSGEQELSTSGQPKRAAS